MFGAPPRWLVAIWRSMCFRSMAHLVLRVSYGLSSFVSASHAGRLSHDADEANGRAAAARL